MSGTAIALLIALSPIILFVLAVLGMGALVMWAEWRTQRFEDLDE